MKFWLEDSNKANFEYARLLTTHYSKSFYISARMLPRERRWATYALYAFCRYVDNLVDNPRSRTQEEIQKELQYLSQEIKLAYRTGESEHPVLSSFITVVRKYSIPVKYSLDLIEGVKMDIQYTRYKNFDDLYLFCYRVAAVVGLMMTYVLGYSDEKAFKYAEKLGVAMQLTNIIRDVKEDKDMGRIYLPLDELESFGITEEDIINEKMTPDMRELIKFQTERADSYYEQANHGIQMLAPESQFAIYSASRIYRGILKKIEKQDYNPFLERIFVSKPKKIAILLQEFLQTKFSVYRRSLNPYL